MYDLDPKIHLGLISDVFPIHLKKCYFIKYEDKIKKYISIPWVNKNDTKAMSQCIYSWALPRALEASNCCSK